MRSLREDLEVAHETVARWLGILENLYVCFRIPPFGSPRIRAVKKENKLYLWDWSQTPAGGARFENLVACHLLKYCHRREDTEGHRMDLRFIRDTDGREVDFVVIEDSEPLFAVECKTGEQSPSKAIRYFRERNGHPGFLPGTSRRAGLPVEWNSGSTVPYLLPGSRFAVKAPSRA